MELFDKSRRNKLKSNTQRTTISNKKEDIKIKEPIKKEEEHEEDLNISEKEKDLSKIAKNKIKKLNEQNDEPIIYMKSNNYLQTVDPIPQINFVPKKKFPLKWKIIIISSIILLLLLIIFLILYFTGVISPSKPPEESETNYKQEDLISGLNYKQNQIMKFRNIKRTNIFFDFADMDPSNNSKTLIEYFDYVIGITNHDKVIENSIEKDTFSGFIFLENYLIDNETDKMLLQNSNLLEQNEKRNNKRNLLEEKKYFNYSLKELKPFCCIDNGTLPIMKFDFYRNGKINKIYMPKNLDNFFYDQITDLLEKIIPKILRSDFNRTNKNISEALEIEYEKIKNRTASENEEEDEEEEELLEEEFDLYHEYVKEGDEDFVNDLEEEDMERRRLNGNRKKLIKNEINFRKLEINNTNDDKSYEINSDQNSEDEIEMDDSISQEYNTNNDFNLYLYNNEAGKDELNILMNNTNLNYYSHSIVRNEYLECKGSQQNISINSLIDELEQTLKEIHYIHKGLLLNDTNFKSELEQEKKESCSNDNLIDCNDLSEDEDENIVDSKIKSIDYEVIEDIISMNNYIDNNQKIINKLKDAFNEYEYNVEIYSNNERNTPQKRFLKDLTDYIMANKFEYSDVEIQIDNKKRKRHLDEEDDEDLDDNEYYGLKDSEYRKSIFNLNIIGLQMKLEVVNTMKIKEGKSTVKIKLQFAFIKISITLKTIKTNLHYAIRNYNEMGFTELYLINESNNKLINRTDHYSNIIVNLEKEFNELNINKYDFSNIFKESFNDMYEQIKNFTSAIFQELIEIIRTSYDNYTHILEEVNNNKHEVFNEIRNQTKKEYIDFIYEMLDLVEEFNNKTFDFLVEVSNEVSRINNFQIDLLYDLIDIVYEAKKIFKDFNKNLFLAIEKGIKTFKLDFKDFIHEIMGDLLYLVEFLSVNVNKNDIFKKAIDVTIREELTWKLRNIRNIINVIVDNLLNNIELDYKRKVDVSNLNSIKYYSEAKLKKYLEQLEERSTDIINDIKSKIAFMNLYELYADNVDKVEEITNKPKNIFFNKLDVDTLEKVKQIEPEYLNENSFLIENRDKLINVMDLIDDYINKEVKDINEYISNYTNNFKIKRQYFVYYNYYNFRKSFIDISLEKLRNEFIKLINDTVLISINNTLNKNYELGIQYFKAMLKKFISMHYRDEYLTQPFWTKYSKFIKTFQTYLPNCYSEKSISIYKQYYNKIRNDIINNIRNKLEKINYYYFNISLYEEDFYFIHQLKEGINYLMNEFENYLSEDFFDIQLTNYIYKFTTSNLNPINDQLYKQFENLRKKIERESKGTRGRNWGDYAYNKHRIHHWHYRSIAYSGNYRKLDSTFNEAKKFIQNRTNIIINEFIGRFTPFLDSYVSEIKSLFDGLYNYTEEKINKNEEINKFTNKYNEILTNMSEIANYNNEKILGQINIKYLMENVENNITEIKNNFFDNYYLINYTSYLEYPDEVLYKISNLEKDLIFSYDVVKKQINIMLNKKISRVKKENHYFIYKTKDMIDKLIKLKINDKQIFDEYKKYRINNNLNIIFEKFNYIYDNDNEFDLNEIANNDKNITSIINNYKNIVSEIEERINDDWIFENCTESDILNETYYTDDISSDINENKTYLICYKYKNKSYLNYNTYNFDVVKVRRAIYYIKYLYENLESLFDEFNFDYLLNITKIKLKDEIINDKNIFNIYEKSKEKLIEINREAEELLNDYLIYFKEDINETIINELDFFENFDKFKTIINFTDNNFVFEVNKKINNTELEFLKLLNEYNQTLREQIKLIKKYEKYNFNNTIFQGEIENILKEILSYFDILENKINNILDDYLMNNALKAKIESLYEEKENYFGNIVESLSKNYEIKPFNLSFNSIDTTKIIIKHLSENMMFNLIHEYIELYESNRNIFINSLLEIIEIKKEEAIDKYNKIINEFFNELDKNSTKYIDKNYVINYKNNYSICINYSLDDLNDYLLKDQEDFNKYIIYKEKLEICSQIFENEYNLSNIDLTKLNINNSSINELIEKIYEKQSDSYEHYSDEFMEYNNTEKEELLKELNEYLKNFCNDIINNPITFINKTEILLDCKSNKWYLNYHNITFYDNFDSEILNNFEIILSKMNETINSYYIGGEFVSEYLSVSDLIQLNKSEDLPEKKIKNNLENFRDMSEYINYRNDKIYSILLKNELIKAFNDSFKDFIDNIITGDIEDNVVIFIFSKIDINVDYIKEKTINEDKYYIFLLNKTKELGITSKKALISLYDYINDRVNKTLHYQIEDYISDNIVFFYRENKYIFKEFFIDYFSQDKNKLFKIDNIFNLESYLTEFIYSRDFNKTLENLSNEFLSKLLIDNINNNIQNELIMRITPLSLALKDEQEEIEIELKNVITVELYESMKLLEEMIDNYTDLVNKQNNRFKFIVSNLPLEKFEFFSENYLEPPLDRIKEYYDMIQNELLKKVDELLSQMKDFYAEIQIVYNIIEQMNNMYNVIKNTYDNLVNYCQIFIDDIDKYDDILVLYTYLGENNYNLRILNDYLRSDKKDIYKIRKIYNLINNETYNKILRKLAKYDVDNYNKNKIKNNQSSLIINQDQNRNKNKINNKKSSYNYNYNNDKSYNKKPINNKRRLSANSGQGSVGISTLDKESQKFIRALNSFNRTYLIGDFLKITINWIKEVNKIKKYLINSERTIELSLLKLASIITEDKMNTLEEMLYFKYNQISSHVNLFMNLTSNQIDNFINLLENSSEVLNKTYDEVNQKILFDFYELKELITSQIGEIKKKSPINKENIDANEKLNDLFKNKNIYQPIGINILKTNDTQRIINHTKSNTVNKYRKILRYSKYCVFNNTNEKFDVIKNIIEQSKMLINYKRRIEEVGQGTKTPPNQGQNNNQNTGDGGKENQVESNKENDFEVSDKREFDLMKGKLSFEFKFLGKIDFGDKLAEKFPIFKTPIPLILPLKLVLKPRIILGFSVSFKFETKLYETILNTDKIFKEISNVKNEKEKKGDTKFTFTEKGEGEASMDIGLGIVEPNSGPVKISILVGINGLLGRGEIGYSLQLNLQNFNFNIDTFFIIEAFAISFFLKLEFEIDVAFYKMTFTIYIFILSFLDLSMRRIIYCKKQ